ncbi:MAG: FimV/HubP family polar landmark protein [Gammaproteobacteria bacterium]|nr:FimV/HubP family polar landmark protein [Gammaproteobacteria bacterium]
MNTLLNDINYFILYLNEHSSLRYMLIAVIISLLLVILSAGRLSRFRKNKTIAERAFKIDFSNIAGEDVIATQLDLAKAYIEMNQTKMAKQILNKALKHGNSSQQQEARQLVDTL